MTRLSELLARARQLELGDIMAWPPPARRALMGLLLMLAGLGAIFYIALPRQQALLQAQQQGQKLKQELDRHQARAATRPAYQAHVADLARQLQHQLEQLPDQNTLEELRTRIAQLRSRHDLQEKLFKPLPRHERSLYTVWPHELVIQGRFQQLAGFISRLAALSQLVSLHDVAIRQATKASAASDELEARLQLHIYHDHADQADQIARLRRELGAAE